MDTVRVVMDFCESRFGLKISASDIITGYRVLGLKKRPSSNSCLFCKQKHKREGI